MPTISKIRLTNVVYENGGKRYNNQLFDFDGENGIFLLENGGGKTVFLQTVLQAIVPHIDMADRKIRDTLSLDGSPAHIAVEWILNERPRRYALTAVSLYMENNVLKSLKYAYDYGVNDKNDIEGLPFVMKNKNGKSRPADKGEMSDYYARMKQQHLNAMIFSTKTAYHDYIREEFKIIPSEWQKIATINSAEGDIESFFEQCKTTDQLVNNLLIPVIEDALQGKEKVDFVQTFEKQREHFKQNKRLLNEIDQFKTIKEKVDDYVEQYHKLHLTEKSYRDIKKTAKKFIQFIVDELTKKNQIKALLEDEYKQYEADKRTCRHKEDSIEIYRLGAEKETILGQLNALKKQLSSQDDILRSAEQRILNIEFTKEQRQVENKLGMLKSLENELAEKEQNDEELDLRSKKDALQAFIKGAFIELLDDFYKEKVLVLGRVEREKDTLNHLKEVLSKKTDLITAKKGEISGFDATIRLYQKEIDQVLRGIVDPVNEGNISLYSSEWKKAMTEKENSISDYNKRMYELNQLSDDLDQHLRDLRDKRLTCEMSKTAIETTLKGLKSEQEKIIEQVESVLYDLNIYDTIYTKEESIKNGLKDKIDRLAKNYEKTLLTERVTSRLADLYMDVPFFVSDPFINEKIQQFSHQVDYVEHGVAYLKQLIETSGQSIEKVFRCYPYWASTFVTTEKSKEKTIAFIDNLKDELTGPVHVLTTQEVKDILSGDKKGLEWMHPIFPKSWKDNLSTSVYHKWQDDIIIKSTDAKEKRVEIERRLNDLRSVYKITTDYFHKYPSDFYNEQVDRLDSIKSQSIKLSEELVKSDDLRIKYQEEKNKIIMTVDQMNQEIKGLEQNYMKSVNLIKKIKEKEQNLFSIKECQQTLSTLENDKGIKEKEVSDQEEVLVEITRCLYDVETSIRNIEADNLYRDLKDIEPAYSKKSLELLKEELSRLEDRLKGFDSGIRDIEDRIKLLKEGIEENHQTINRLKKRTSHPLQQLVVFSEEEIDTLSEKVSEITDKIKTLQKELENKNTDFIKIDTKEDMKMKTLLESFDGLYVFEETMENMASGLAESKKELSAREEKLKKRMTTNTEEILFLSETRHVMDVESEKHGLGDIKYSSYDENAFIDFAYEKERYIKKLQDKLMMGLSDFKKVSQYIATCKEKYLEFCKSTIKEPKLKDMAIKGIVNKPHYQDLLDYQLNMGSVLNRNIKLAEDDRRESDAELQTFLRHLLSYAKNILDELDTIQKKTKIKVDDVYKQIFIFNIPKWDALEAKESLRRYIDHLVVAYDEEAGKIAEDKEALRQFIEKKLSVKNLITRTLGDKTIKIKCRKVTNDLKINQAPLTWESSNKWSGGEKWSKNMTLFLSLLNYLAEKKQYLSVEQKRHRTVILDNPFGKASSRHVLDPVFFVAENLGFQMIAVTAHAEGKFVTDYFPIVYSGKLRNSSDTSKKIMEMERSLNTVYLKMKSPDTLLRFDESEQLSFLKN